MAEGVLSFMNKQIKSVRGSAECLRAMSGDSIVEEGEKPFDEKRLSDFYDKVLLNAKNEGLYKELCQSIDWDNDCKDKIFTKKLLDDKETPIYVVKRILTAYKNQFPNEKEIIDAANKIVIASQNQIRTSP